MDKVKIGIVGVGHLGKLHLKNLLAQKIAICSGIFDIDQEKSQSIAEEFKIKSFDNLAELFKSSDAVIIATTTSTHYEVGKIALENKLHIFIEKPITSTIEEAEELIQLAKEKDCFIQVGHIERFNPAILALEKYALNPMFIQSDRLSQFNPRGTDVAVVLDLMIHDIDIILHLVKSEVEKIDANGVAVVSDSIDISNARIQFKNGCVANVTASRISQKKMRKMRMFQKDAYITIDFLQGLSEIYRLVKPDEEVLGISYGEIGVGEKRRKVVYEQPEIPEVNAMKYEQELFIKSILNHTPPVVSGDDGKKALEVADSIIRLIQENKLMEHKL
jgi:predicted dehydrogenase